MTVGELREALEEFDEDTEVMLSYDYGDRSHTSVAEHIRQVHIRHVAWSGYLRMYEVDGSERFEESRPPMDVVILE
jgi:hypothetical protein